MQWLICICLNFLNALKSEVWCIFYGSFGPSGNKVMAIIIIIEIEILVLMVDYYKGRAFLMAYGTEKIE